MEFPVSVMEGERSRGLRVLVVHPFFDWEVLYSSFGGGRLILETLRFFARTGCKVFLFSLTNPFSFVSFLSRLENRARIKVNKSSGFSRLASVRGVLGILFILFRDLLCSVDFLFRRGIKNVIGKVKPDLVIYNTPFCGSVLGKISRKLGASFIIYEHNVEWLFFSNKIGGSFFRVLVYVLRARELYNLKYADAILCVNENDKKILVASRVKKRVDVWIPPPSKVKMKPVNLPADLLEKLKDKFVVGFVGTNFEVNVASVEVILKVAEKVLGNVIFLVIGSVKKAFEGRPDIPSNVIFTGFVNDLDTYLSVCDAFINPKVGLDTGIEAKLYDFLKFNKPVIATKAGAKGFEKFDNMIIADSLSDIVDTLNSLAIEKIENNMSV